jgi:U3 small nucleolar RNA-associated protein MPP10
MGRGRSSKEAKKPEQADSSSSSRCASLEALAKLEKHLEDVSQYCNPSNDTKDSLASVMKLLFDSSVVLSRAQFGPFTELIVDGFDSESIWEEVQTRNRPLIRFIKKKITKILKSVKAKYVDPSKANAKLHPVNQVIDEDGYAYEYGDGDDIEDDEDEIDDHRLNRGDDDSDDDGEDNIDDDEEEGWADDDEENGVHDDEEDGDDEEDDKDGLSPPAGIDDEEEDNMEKWLDSMEDLEDKHQRKLERLEKLAGHKGAAEKVAYTHIALLCTFVYYLSFMPHIQPLSCFHEGSGGRR